MKFGRFQIECDKGFDAGKGLGLMVDIPSPGLAVLRIAMIRREIRMRIWTRGFEQREKARLAEMAEAFHQEAQAQLFGLHANHTTRQEANTSSQGLTFH